MVEELVLSQEYKPKCIDQLVRLDVKLAFSVEGFTRSPAQMFQTTSYFVADEQPYRLQ